MSNKHNKQELENMSTRLKTLQLIGYRNKLSVKLQQALQIYMACAMERKLEIFYSENGVSVKVGTRYQRIKNIHEYMEKLVNDGENTKESNFGGDIVQMTDRGQRERCVLKKLYELLENIELFKDFYASCAKILGAEHWTSPFGDWFSEASEAPPAAAAAAAAAAASAAVASAAAAVVTGKRAARRPRAGPKPKALPAVKGRRNKRQKLVPAESVHDTETESDNDPEYSFKAGSEESSGSESEMGQDPVTRARQEDPSTGSLQARKPVEETVRVRELTPSPSPAPRPARPAPRQPSPAPRQPSPAPASGHDSEENSDPEQSPAETESDDGDAGGSDSDVNDDEEEEEDEDFRGALTAIQSASAKTEAEFLKAFLDSFMPNLREADIAPVKMRAPPKIPVSAQAKQFVEKIEQVKRTPIDDAIRKDLHDKPNLAEHQVETVCQWAAMMKDPCLTLRKAILGGGVGSGKTRTAAYCAYVWWRFFVKGVFGVMVITPPWLVKQFASEIQLALGMDVGLFHATTMEELTEALNCARECMRLACLARTDKLVFVVVGSQALYDEVRATELNRFLGCLRSMLIVDEAHLYFKRNGLAGGLLQSLRWNVGDNPFLLLTATMISRGDKEEAINVVLFTLGMAKLLPCEAVTDSNYAQAVIESITIRVPVTSAAMTAPPPVHYTMYVPAPAGLGAKKRKDARTVRMLRCGNGLHPMKYPPSKYAILCALALQKHGRGSLVFYDNVIGIKSIRAWVTKRGPELRNIFFLYGDMKQSDKDGQMAALRACTEPRVFFTTYAAGSTGHDLGNMFSYVLLVGACVYDQETYKQCVGRAVRPSTRNSVTSFSFTCNDSCSSKTRKIVATKRRKTTMTTGVLTVDNDAGGGGGGGGGEEQEAERKPTVRCLDDALAVMVGLYGLAQRKAALNPTKLCYEVTSESPVQPPERIADARKACEEARKIVMEDLVCLRDPAQAALRRQEQERVAAERAAAERAAAERAAAERVAAEERAAAEQAAAERAAAELAAAEERAAAEQAAADRAAAELIAAQMLAARAVPASSVQYNSIMPATFYLMRSSVLPLDEVQDDSDLTMGDGTR